MSKSSWLIHRIVLILTLLLLIIFITACTKTPDVRVTFCQDLTWILLGSPDKMQWHEHQPIIKGYDDLEMEVHFATIDNGATNNAQSSCFYRYEENGISDISSFQNPIAAYSTYPNKMSFKGQIVDKKLLNQTIQKLSSLQVQETIKRVLNK
ncbi:MAG: hypothetical protein KZQ83_07645 [gamma proteobacterium symbiont of Taylorina sp.]|nr:hypothetical protein [gamma proteobacterium symbiont of Taylorina sp.]